MQNITSLLMQHQPSIQIQSIDFKEDAKRFFLVTHLATYATVIQYTYILSTFILSHCHAIVKNLILIYKTPT